MLDWLGVSFMPHGHCWLWSVPMLVLQVTTNAVIGIAYLSISLTLAWLAYRIYDIPFRTTYLAFGLFIVTCGLTHALDVWVIWHPDYWVDASVRTVTAVASLGTAIALPRLVPKAEALARGAKAVHDRGLRLETLVDDLARSYEQAKELDALKTAFFANVSHELRTPLALILAPTERLLASGRLDPDAARDLEVVRRNAGTLLRHVQDLLDLAKLEAKRATVDYAFADLAVIVRVSLAYFDSFAAERGVTIQSDVLESLPATVDPRKIERVVLNLLSNAFKFTPPGGRVRVSLAAQGGEALLEVADSGPGVPEGMRTAVFERFRQLDSGPARPFGGTGIGLAITKEFVELHGGTVTVDEAPEGGARFVLRLPLSAPEGALVRTTERREGVEEEQLARVMVGELRTTEPLHQDRGDGERPHVLVVEDNPDLNRFIAEVLSERYSVDTARDGSEGFERATASPPDLVVTDLMMPGTSGETLVRRLRDEGPAVPVLVLTAVADEDRRIALLQSGVDDYLMKPFRVEELHARVHRLVSMKVARDVLTRELAGREGDLADLARQLAERSKEIACASMLKTALLRMVTHELRTPLHVLRLQLEVVRRDPTRAQSLVEQQRRTLGRLDEMVEAMLLHARIEAGRLEVVSEPVDLLALCREVVAEAGSEAFERGLELRVEGEVVSIETDRRLVRMVITNLVNNAVKFTPTGRVVVRVQEGGDEGLVEVEDTGLGIPHEDQERVFSAFEQVTDTSHKHLPGVGLGLSLVREFMRALGGSVRLTSEPGRGSTFTVAFPRRQPWAGPS